MFGRSNKEKALINSLKKGYLGKAMSLVDEISEPNKRGKQQLTALLAATGEKDGNYENSLDKEASICAEIVKKLLAKGADPDLCDDQGRSPLMNAAIQCNTIAFKCLLDKGADIHLKDSGGMTALMHAAEWQSFEQVKGIIEKGANTEELDSDGISPLLHALSSRSFDCEEGEVLPIVELLLENKKKIKRDFEPDLTAALWQALGSENPKSAKALVLAGADIHQTSGDGMTPLQWAQDFEYVDLASLLENMMGERSAPIQTPTDTLNPDMVSLLKDLCNAYSQNNEAKIERIEPRVKEIGETLHRQGGLSEMRKYFESVQGQPGARTLEMCWGGIGDWRA